MYKNYVVATRLDALYMSRLPALMNKVQMMPTPPTKVALRRFEVDSLVTKM